MKSFFQKSAAVMLVLSMLFMFSSCRFDLAGSIAAFPPSVDPAKPAFILSDIGTLDKSAFIPLTKEELAGQTAAEGAAFSKDKQGNILIANKDGTFGMNYRYDEAGDGWCIAQYDKNSLLTEYMWTDKGGIYRNYSCENGEPVRSACSLTGIKGTAKAFYGSRGSLLGIMAGSGEVGWYDGTGGKLAQDTISEIKTEFFNK